MNHIDHPNALKTSLKPGQYVGVGESEDVQAFYYFIESEKNPKEDPLMLWLTGGPGCSALSGLVFEIGPLGFKNEEYNGSLPKLVLRPHSWTKVSSIIFVDLPVFTGFTYPTTDSAAQRSDWKLVHQVHQFLRKWLIDHPNFLSNQVYIGGDSYSGIPIPVIVQEISQGNEKGVQPWINLQPWKFGFKISCKLLKCSLLDHFASTYEMYPLTKSKKPSPALGYLLGNAATTQREKNYQIPFAHGMALISDELYQSLQENCKGEYINVDTRNVLCSRDIKSFKEATSGINSAHILEPSCETFDTEKSRRRSLIKKYPTNNSLNTHLKLPSLSCRSYVYFLCEFWANDDNVRNALHIRQGSIEKWRRCTFDIPRKMDIPSSYDYHVNLSRLGYRSLIYSGDHDFVVPFLATQAWIRSLNYSIVDDWRQWNTNGQVAGQVFVLLAALVGQIPFEYILDRVEGTQLQSTSLKNALPCTVDGYLTGLFLCQILNKLRPGIVNVISEPDNSLPSQSENVKSFLKALDAVGLPRFEISDLEKGSMKADMVKDAMGSRGRNEGCEDATEDVMGS
ncbi:unnamed protein product [Sphenostylis stenocarpa]|uniref:Calponin-homology (CH) domain-containing protein n=1 Tax=Sphenostylis stenocarpa TaxID=92480 RepID=A0AA86SJF0_9FABA|nr:unnamed protein product [Sphenostylis stenocarpa]